MDVVVGAELAPDAKSKHLTREGAPATVGDYVNGCLKLGDQDRQN